MKRLLLLAAALTFNARPAAAVSRALAPQQAPPRLGPAIPLSAFAASPPRLAARVAPLASAAKALETLGLPALTTELLAKTEAQPALRMFFDRAKSAMSAPAEGVAANVIVPQAGFASPKNQPRLARPGRKARLRRSSIWAALEKILQRNLPLDDSAVRAEDWKRRAVNILRNEPALAIEDALTRALGQTYGLSDDEAGRAKAWLNGETRPLVRDTATLGDITYVATSRGVFLRDAEGLRRMLPLLDGDIKRLAVSPTALFALNSEGALYKFSPGDAAWSELSKDLTLALRDILVVGDTLYLAARDGVYVRDGGGFLSGFCKPGSLLEAAADWLSGHVGPCKRLGQFLDWYDLRRIRWIDGKLYAVVANEGVYVLEGARWKMAFNAGEFSAPLDVAMSEGVLHVSGQWDRIYGIEGGHREENLPLYKALNAIRGKYSIWNWTRKTGENFKVETELFGKRCVIYGDWLDGKSLRLQAEIDGNKYLIYGDSIDVYKKNGWRRMNTDLADGPVDYRVTETQLSSAGSWTHLVFAEIAGVLYASGYDGLLAYEQGDWRLEHGKPRAVTGVFELDGKPAYATDEGFWSGKGYARDEFGPGLKAGWQERILADVAAAIKEGKRPRERPEPAETGEDEPDADGTLRDENGRAIFMGLGRDR